MPHVLIIDDEPGIRMALRRWFERQQYAVSEAADGQAALSQLEQASVPPDVIICDLHLPQLSGAELIRHLAIHAPAVAARVVLTTGDDVTDAEPGSILCEHPHVLQKPFDFAALRTIIATFGVTS